MENKKAMVWNEIGWWVIGLAVLAMVVVAIMLAKHRGISIFEELKNMMRFGK